MLNTVQISSLPKEKEKMHHSRDTSSLFQGDNQI